MDNLRKMTPLWNIKAFKPILLDSPENLQYWIFSFIPQP